MIEYQTKDITTVTKGTVVHGCNCSGAFGSGVAGAVRKAWPEAYEMFQENGTGEDLLGTVSVFFGCTYPNLTIINGYTQVNYGNDGKVYADLKAIKTVLERACEFAKIDNKKLYMPKIGCGLGGLNWNKQVLPIVEHVNRNFSGISIIICEL